MARSFHHSPSFARRGRGQEERCHSGDGVAETRQAAAWQGECCVPVLIAPCPPASSSPGSGLQPLWLVRPIPPPAGSKPPAPRLPPRSHVIHMSCSWLFPAAFDLEAVWLDVPRHITGCSSSICPAALGFAPAPGVRSLPEPSWGWLEPTVLLQLWNHPCPHHNVPWVHPCLSCIRPSPGVGRSLPGRVCAQMLARG